MADSCGYSNKSKGKRVAGWEVNSLRLEVAVGACKVPGGVAKKSPRKYVSKKNSWFWKIFLRKKNAKRKLFRKGKICRIVVSPLSNQGVGCLNPVSPFGVFSSFCWSSLLGGKKWHAPPAPSVCVSFACFFCRLILGGLVGFCQKALLKKSRLWFVQLQACYIDAKMREYWAFIFKRA